VAKLLFVAGETEDGARLDQAVAGLAFVSRSQARRWIDEDRVRLSGRPTRASARVAPGDEIEAEPPEPLPSRLEPEPIPLAVLFEDADLCVVDKPAGLVVHPAPGHRSGTLVHALLHHCGDELSGVGGVQRPGIVHRLDKGTSGVMVVAKRDAAHRTLAAQFRDHTVERVYLALVRGAPRAESGRIERPVGRHPRDRKRMTTAAGGREAATAWRVLRRLPAGDRSRGDRTWLALRPETGRTHQIRVHLASVGLPVVGDPVYGRRARGASPGRPALHAAVLGFAHPRTGERMRFEAPLPPELAALLPAGEPAEPSP